jgi:hypothetical protein
MKSLAALLLACAALLSHEASAVTIGFAPDTVIAGVGDSFTVDIVVSDLGSDVVAGFDLDVLFDPAVLLATSVAFGPYLGAATVTASDLTVPGVADLFQASFLSTADLAALQTGPFALATLGFDVVGAGSSSLSFRFDSVNMLVGGDGQVLDVTARSGSVGAVPEPSAALVFATGCALVGLRLRRPGARRRSD